MGFDTQRQHVFHQTSSKMVYLVVAHPIPVAYLSHTVLLVEEVSTSLEETSANSQARRTSSQGNVLRSFSIHFLTLSNSRSSTSFRKVLRSSVVIHHNFSHELFFMTIDQCRLSISTWRITLKKKTTTIRDTHFDRIYLSSTSVRTTLICTTTTKRFLDTKTGQKIFSIRQKSGNTDSSYFVCLFIFSH